MKVLFIDNPCFTHNLIEEFKKRDCEVLAHSNDTDMKAIDNAIKRMKKRKFNRLPVVQTGKELVGIITARDILNFNPEVYPELEELAQIKEEQEKILHSINSFDIIDEGKPVFEIR